MSLTLPRHNMMKAILDRPWLMIIGGYLLGISGWMVMVMLAVKHQPESIPTGPEHAEHAAP